MADPLVRCDDCDAPIVLNHDGTLRCLECRQVYAQADTPAPTRTIYRQKWGAMRGGVKAG